jgi:TIGR03009 family protein
MRFSTGLISGVSLVLMSLVWTVTCISSVAAEDQSWRGSGQSTGNQPAKSALTGQAIRPVQVGNQPQQSIANGIGGQPAQATGQPSRAPFRLTPGEQEYVEKVLKAWEYYSNQILTFDTKFALRTYDSTFQTPGGGPVQPRVSQGVLKYKKSDLGLFSIEGDRPEKWLCDGDAIFQYKYDQKVLVEYPLAPEAKGHALENGPMPFVFGAPAAKLKERYWIRPIAPPEGVKDQIWLKIYPRRRDDAAEYREADLILSTKSLTPMGVKLYSPNGQTEKSFTFFDTVINQNDLLGFLKGDPFKPNLPSGWTKQTQR